MRRALFLLLTLIAVMACQRTARADQNQSTVVQRLEPELRNYLVRRSGLSPENFVLHILAQEALTLPSGSVQFRVLRGPTTVGAGVQTFQVAVDRDGKEEARFFVRAEIKVVDEVVVAARPIGPREILSAQDVRLERREFTAANTRPYGRLDDVVGKQTARAIGRGELLVQNLLDRPTLMRRGSTITLLYDSLGLRIETPGVAEESGRAGDFIQVKNISSGKAMRGEVIDERTVKVN